MENFIAISGCSGGGKSTLLAELAVRGHRTVEEPGRRVVAAELAQGGDALPWLNMEDFLRKVLALAIADHDAARAEPGWIFFDRGVVDAAVGLLHLTGETAFEAPIAQHRYAKTVFLVPPWPEIYMPDDARRHGFDAAVAEHERLAAAYPAYGYHTCLLPKVPVSARADWLIARLAAHQLP